MVARRRELVAALADCADRPYRPVARRFLCGLSADEMQFIAEFLGASILELHETCRAEAAGVSGASDRNHKLLVLSEFLRRTGLEKTLGPAPARSGSASAR
jgi:hypothetical protein